LTFNNDIFQQAMANIIEDVPTASTPPTAQYHPTPELNTEALHGLLNGPCNTSVSTSGHSFRRQSVIFQSNFGSSDQIINSASQFHGEHSKIVMEDNCQTVNGTGPDISCSRKRRSFSSDSNDSLTSKKSKTTDWRGKKRAESEECEKKIINLDKEIEETESDIKRKDIYLAGLQKRPLTSTPTYSSFFEYFYYMEGIEKDVAEMENKLESQRTGSGKGKTHKLGNYINDQKELMKLKNKLLGVKKSLNQVLDDKIDRNSL